MKKLSALLFLVTAQRVQTLHRKKLSCVHVHDKGCSIQIVNKLKHSQLGHHQPALELQRFEQDQKLCVVNSLSEYIQKPRTVRNDTDQLLLWYTKPFGPASKDSIARWLKSVSHWMQAFKILHLLASEGQQLQLCLIVDQQWMTF